MNKYIKYLICLLIVFCLFGVVVYADMNLNVTYVESFDNIYDVDVLVNGNFSLNSDNFKVTSLPDGFELVNLCGRTENNHGQNGVIDKDTCLRSGGKYFGYSTIYGVNKSLVYTNVSNIVGGDNGGLKEIPGEIVLTFKNAATLNDGTYADIVMTIDNMKMKINADTDQPVMILKQGAGSMGLGADSSGNWYSGSYDIAFELLKDGSKVQNSTMGIIFSDLDVYLKDYSSFAESIELMWGVKNNDVYRKAVPNPNDYLIVSHNNTKYTTTERNTEVGGLSDPESDKAGFALKIKSNGFKYNWTGTECATDIGFIKVDNPNTGNVLKVILSFVLLGVSGLVMFIFLRKVNKAN